MKINRIFMLLAASSMMLASCSDIVDNDNRKGDIVDDLQGNNIHLISAGTEFIASGETKTIVASTEVARVEALYQQSTDPTVVNEPEWLTFNIKGKTVEVTAAPNASTQSRDVMVRLYSEGGDFTEVNLQQQGLVYLSDAPALLKVGDEAGASTFNVIKGTDGITYVPQASWIHVKVNADGTFTISYDANGTGFMRRGEVKVMFGDVLLGTIAVQQASIDDILGTYQLVFDNKGSGQWVYVNAIIDKAADGTYNMIFPGDDWTIPLAVDEDNLSVSIKAGEYIGDWNGYFVHTVLYDATAGYITWDTSVSYSASFVVESEEGEDYQVAYFEDNGSFEGQEVSGIVFYACTATPITSDNRYGYLYMMVTPYLLKVSSDTTVTAQTTTAVRPATKAAGNTAKARMTKKLLTPKF